MFSSFPFSIPYFHFSQFSIPDTIQMNEYSLIQSQTLRILHFFCELLMNLDPGFRAKFQKIVTCVAFSIKFAKTNQKFAENSEFCENYSLLFKIIHWCPQFWQFAGQFGRFISVF